MISIEQKFGKHGLLNKTSDVSKLSSTYYNKTIQMSRNWKNKTSANTPIKQSLNRLTPNFNLDRLETKSYLETKSDIEYAPFQNKYLKPHYSNIIQIQRVDREEFKF